MKQLPMVIPSGTGFQPVITGRRPVPLFLVPKLPLGHRNNKGDPTGRPYVSLRSQVQLGNEKNR